MFAQIYEGAKPLKDPNKISTLNPVFFGSKRKPHGTTGLKALFPFTKPGRFGYPLVWTLSLAGKQLEVPQLPHGLGQVLAENFAEAWAERSSFGVGGSSKNKFVVAFVWGVVAV